jgi:soluble cytochrome b562
MKNILVILALTFSLAGCGTGIFKVEPITEVAVPTSLSEAGKEAQNIINEANLLLTAATNVNASNYTAGLVSQADARKYQGEIKKVAKQVDDAQAMLSVGNDAGALSSAKLVNLAITALHKEIAARAKETQ